jgi:hypothetical protein
VLKDGDRDQTQPLIAVSSNQAGLRATGAVHQSGETATFYCGYGHGPFGCVDGAIGDASYLPVEVTSTVRRVSFVIRDSGHPAAAGYVAPCRDAEGTAVSPCAVAGGRPS